MSDPTGYGGALADARTPEDFLAVVDRINSERAKPKPGEATKNPLEFQRDLITQRMIFSDNEEARQNRINLQCRELPHTDLGNSQRFVLRFGRDAFYCHPFKSWFCFDGQRWLQDTKGLIQEYGKDGVIRLGDEAPLLDYGSDQQAAYKWAAVSQSHGRITSMLDLAKSALARSPDCLDNNSHLLNFPNGTLDLLTMEFHTQKREDHITKITQCCYDQFATAPMWDEFLEVIMDGNVGLIRFLQRAAGYSLTGNTGERAFFLCHGQGANGKSTFLNTLRTIVGDYGFSAQASTFCISRSEAVRNDIAAMKGARLITSTEAGKGKRLDEEIIKVLTGGEDKVRVRFLFQEEFEYKPECKIWWSFNTAPRITDSTESIWTRVKMIPFLHVIPYEKRDKEFGAKLLAESSGIMNWMLSGLQEYRSIGLAEPNEVKTATAEYRENEDVLGDFFKDMCIIEPGVSCGATDLYQAYVKWHIDIAPDEKAKSQRSFGFEMTDRGFKRERDGATKRKLYLGIRLAKGGF